MYFNASQLNPLPVYQSGSNVEIIEGYKIYEIASSRARTMGVDLVHRDRR